MLEAQRTKPIYTEVTKHSISFMEFRFDHWREISAPVAGMVNPCARATFRAR